MKPRDNEDEPWLTTRLDGESAHLNIETSSCVIVVVFNVSVTKAHKRVINENPSHVLVNYTITCWEQFYEQVSILELSFDKFANFVIS